MGVARVLSSCAAVIAVASGTAVAISVGRAASVPDASATPYSMPTIAASAPLAPTWPLRRATPVTTATVSHPARPAQSTPPSVKATHPAVHRAAPHPAAAPRTTHAAAPASPRPAARPAPQPARQPPAPSGQSLPVAGHAPGSTRVITVAASSYRSTTATLQAWVSARGGGWLKHGPAILAHVGADGVSTAPSESRSATPVGSFTLTQAFGTYSNPGTGLPYFQATSADWWISQGGALYNTHQRCSSGCGFTRGDPNEHLAYIVPFYRYSVVIDYNTRNAPGGVRQGKGSAFFLHVTDGNATAGCIGIPQADLVAIMKWLTPSSHPRILIGVT